jgi:hypothetical protein
MAVLGSTSAITTRNKSTRIFAPVPANAERKPPANPTTIRAPSSGEGDVSILRRGLLGRSRQ